MSLLADRMKKASTPAAAPATPAPAVVTTTNAPAAAPVVTTTNADGLTKTSTTTPSGLPVSITDAPAAVSAAPVAGGLAARLKAAKSAAPAVPEGVKPPDAPKTEQAQPAPAPAAPAADAPKKRGRPPKAKPAEGAAPAAPAVTSAAVSAPETAASADDGPTPDDLDLFIDCMPVKGLAFGTVTHLSTLVDGIAQKIAVDEKIIDIRMIDFMKWKGLLAAYFRQNPPKGVVYADSRNDLVQPVIPVLIPLARSVFKSL